jgi:hypothetical protein
MSSPACKEAIMRIVTWNVLGLTGYPSEVSAAPSALPVRRRTANILPTSSKDSVPTFSLCNAVSCWTTPWSTSSASQSLCRRRFQPHRFRGSWPLASGPASECVGCCRLQLRRCAARRCASPLVVFRCMRPPASTTRPRRLGTPHPLRHPPAFGRWPSADHRRRTADFSPEDAFLDGTLCPAAAGACASSRRLPMKWRYGATLQGSVFRRPLRRSLQRAPRLKQSSWATWAKTTPPPITLGPTIKSKSSWTAWISSAPTFSVCSQASFYWHGSQAVGRTDLSQRRY